LQFIRESIHTYSITKHMKMILCGRLAQINVTQLGAAGRVRMCTSVSASNDRGLPTKCLELSANVDAKNGYFYAPDKGLNVLNCQG